jgi:hypothetical protein
MKVRYLLFFIFSIAAVSQKRDSLPLSDRASVAMTHAVTIRTVTCTGCAASTAIGPKTNVVIHFCHAGKCDDSRVHNLRTNGGADMQAAQMATTGAQPAPANWIALSNDSTTPAATDCAAGASSCTLPGEISLNGIARSQATYSHTNGTNVITLSFTFTFTGSQSVQKAGLFNAASNGVMFLEFAFPQRAAQSGDTLQITWTETI